MSATMVYLMVAVPGILLLIVGFMFRGAASSFPKVGMGYRSDLSRLNAETWKEANIFSSKVIIIAAILNIIMWPLATYIFWEGTTMIFISCLAFVCLTLSLIVAQTERHMDHTFTREGARK